MRQPISNLHRISQLPPTVQRNMSINRSTRLFGQTPQYERKVIQEWSFPVVHLQPSGSENAILAVAKKLNSSEVVFFLLGARDLHGLLPKKIDCRLHHHKSRAYVGTSPELSIRRLHLLSTNVVVFYGDLDSVHLHSLSNVQEHAPLSARVSVERAVEVRVTGSHRNRAAGRGCHAAACSTSPISYSGSM